MKGIDVDKLMEETKRLFGDQLWEINMDNLSKVKRRLVKFIKVTRITFDEFAEGRMGFQCVALSYFGALATIPFIGFLFAVTGGLGLSEKVTSFVLNFFAADPGIVALITEKAGNIINTAKSGGVGIISAFFFLWTVIWLMFQVERVFNNVWKIRKIPRKVYKRFGFYFGMLILSPVAIGMFMLGIAFYSNFTNFIGLNFNIKDLSFILTILGWLAIYAITVLILSAMFKFIPAVKVQYKHAFWAAVVAGFIFVVFQYIYLETQVFVTRLNGVYGVLAAVPLFLIWMNYSWQIVIYGAQLSYGLQNVNIYNIPEGRLRDFTPRRDRLREEFREHFSSDNENR